MAAVASSPPNSPRLGILFCSIPRPGVVGYVGRSCSSRQLALTPFPGNSLGSCFSSPSLLLFSDKVRAFSSQQHEIDQTDWHGSQRKLSTPCLGIQILRGLCGVFEGPSSASQPTRYGQVSIVFWQTSVSLGSRWSTIPCTVDTRH